MPARRADDPLVLLPLRVPASLRAVLVAQATEAGSTLSDALRSHLTLAAAKPLGKPVPRRRQPQRLAAVSGADPELIRQVADIDEIDRIRFTTSHPKDMSDELIACFGSETVDKIDTQGAG